MQELRAFVKAANLKAAFVMTCVGSCTHMTIRLANACRTERNPVCPSCLSMSHIMFMFMLVLVEVPFFSAVKFKTFVLFDGVFKFVKHQSAPHFNPILSLLFADYYSGAMYGNFVACRNYQ